MLDDTNNDVPTTDDDIVSRAMRNIADMPGEAPAASIDEEDVVSSIESADEEEVVSAVEGVIEDEVAPVAEEVVEEAAYAAPLDDEETAYSTESFDDEPIEVEGEAVAEEETAKTDDPFAAAGDVARDAHRSIMDGIKAFKSVHEAQQRHNSAAATLRDMREVLDADTAQLQHRIEIEQNYPQIVSEQTAELKAASELSDQMIQRAATLDAERNELDAQLAAMKKRHEDQLRPYRNVAESTKGRADDTASTLADVKRSVKSAETTLAEATKQRDQRLTSANRAVDNAEERLRKVQGDLDEARAGGEATDPDVLARLEREVASEQAHLESARADIPVITEEARKSVEGAQQSLFRQKKVLTQAERDAEAAKKEANERRADYDKILKKFQEEEAATSDQIKARISGAEEARKQSEDAQARMAAAREALDEAEQIHSTPQQTIALRDQIAHEQAEYDQQQDAVDELAANMRALRKGTFKQRLTLILGGVAIVLLAIAIAVAIFMMRNNKPSTTTTTQTQTETTQKKDDEKKESEKETDAKTTSETSDKTQTTTTDDSKTTSTDDAKTTTTSDDAKTNSTSTTSDSSKTDSKTTTTTTTTTDSSKKETSSTNK